MTSLTHRRSTSRGTFAAASLKHDLKRRLFKALRSSPRHFCRGLIDALGTAHVTCRPHDASSAVPTIATIQPARPQHRLNFRPEPQGHGSLRPILSPTRCASPCDAGLSVVNDRPARPRQ